MILTLGDSFTYGDELEDRNQAWPVRLADLLGTRVVNLGLPSNSGPAICRQLLEYFSHKQNDTPSLVVIGWPSPGRVEFADDAGTFNIWPGYSGNLFKQSHPWRDELLKYNNMYHSNQWLFEQYLQNIIFVQRFLESQQVNYLMMNVVGNEYYFHTCRSNFRHYEHMINVAHFIDWNWENQVGMLEWTEDNNCPRGPNGHFLESGHQLVASKVYSYIKELKWE